MLAFAIDGVQEESERAAELIPKLDTENVGAVGMEKLCAGLSQEYIEAQVKRPKNVLAVRAEQPRPSQRTRKAGPPAGNSLRSRNRETWPRQSRYCVRAVTDSGWRVVLIIQ